jgi:hypothetical protein
MTLPRWVKEIEEREKNATPGPWFKEPDKEARSGFSISCIPYIETHKNHDSSARCRLLTSWNQNWNPKDNLEFAAHARTDIPKLIRALSEAMEALRFYAESEHTWNAEYDDEGFSVGFGTKAEKAIARIEKGEQ